MFDLESEEGQKMLHLLNPCKSILRLGNIMPKAVILPMFFCVMRLYIVTKIRKVKKISTNNMSFFHIHMHKYCHYVYKKEDKRVRAVSARPGNII